MRGGGPGKKKKPNPGQDQEKGVCGEKIDCRHGGLGKSTNMTGKKGRENKAQGNWDLDM